MNEYTRQIVTYSLLAIVIGTGLSVGALLLPSRVVHTPAPENASSVSSSIISQTVSRNSISTASSQMPYDQTAFNAKLGIELVATISPSNPITNDSILNITISNILPRVNNVSGVLNWSLPYLVPMAVLNTTVFACQQFASYAILQGYYTSQNASLGKPLAIDDTIAYTESCNELGGGRLAPGDGYESIYLFQPNSSRATGYPPYPYNLQPGNGAGNFTLNVSNALWGYFTYIPPCAWGFSISSSCTSTSANFTPLQTYTLLVGDEWGQLLVFHFEIASST